MSNEGAEDSLSFPREQHRSRGWNDGRTFRVSLWDGIVLEVTLLGIKKPIVRRKQ